MTRPAPGRPRQVSVYIPERYVLRPSKANRVVWVLLSPLFAVLIGVCLCGLLAAGWSLLPLFRLFRGGLVLLGLLALLACLLAVALMLVCPLLALKSWRDSLSVEGERLVLVRWRRKPVEFTFQDIAFVRARRSRETVLLQGQGGRALCRLPVTMEGMDVLQADLRSRRVPFLEGNAPVPDAFILSPGPRRETLTLPLPDPAPHWYRVTHPPAFAAVFLVLLAFTLGCMLFFGLVQREPGVLCFLPFDLLAVIGLVWVRMERTEVSGERLRIRSPRGRVTERTFADVAAVRLSTAATGLGPLSSFQLLGSDGAPFLTVSAQMPGASLLLASLIDRGTPFTY